MPSTPLIALEIHDTTLWEPSRVLPMIETMDRWGYNALVLHQNDLLDACTQLDLTANYGVSDLRLKKVRNNTAWLNHLTARLKDIGAHLYLEIKEPSFHDSAIELFPELFAADGRPNLASDVWPDFCRAKVEDLLERVPDLGGLIVNLSSPESRVSMPDYVATGGDIAISNWFDKMIAAFQDPLGEQGKSLWIRDFSYTPDLQSDVISAVNRCGGTVGASVKITAHDYFPEFPVNPVADHVKAPLIFEFEAFGEHMGWGAIPNCRVQEFRARMEDYRNAGAVGLLVRISWEAVSGATALDSLSAVNVFALPKLVEKDQDAHELVEDWLNDTYSVDGDIARDAAALMLQSWAIPTAAYWNGMVFPRHSCLPSAWTEGWQSMMTKGMGQRSKNLHIDPHDPLLSDDAGHKLFTAKEQATHQAHQLAKAAGQLAPKLPAPLAEHFTTFQWLVVFARQFELATKAAFFAARMRSGDIGKVAALVDELHTLAAELSEQLDQAQNTAAHHRVLFDPEQIIRFANSLPKTRNSKDA